MKTHLSKNWKKDYGIATAACGRSNHSKRDGVMNLAIVGMTPFMATFEKNRCAKCNSIAKQILALQSV